MFFSVSEQGSKKDMESLLPENEIYSNASGSSIPLNLMTPEEFSSTAIKKEVEEFPSGQKNSVINVCIRVIFYFKINFLIFILFCF